jgi:predicted DNA-binding transcriptional regulator YafY
MDSQLHNRYRRIIRFLSYLQSGSRYNAVQLAREFQVSRRTVFRDIALLRDIGIPVSYDDERDGYYVPAGQRLPQAAGLTDNELTMLVLAAHLSLSQLVPETAITVREAIAKLLGTCPEQTRWEVSNLLSVCTADFLCDDSGIADEACVGDSIVLRSILSAIRHNRQIRISIAGPPLGRTTQTKVAPYRVVVSAHRWLLIGRSSVDRKTCSYDIRSIQKVEITEEPYTIPRGFRYRDYEQPPDESAAAPQPSNPLRDLSQL